MGPFAIIGGALARTVYARPLPDIIVPPFICFNIHKHIEGMYLEFRAGEPVTPPRQPHKPPHRNGKNAGLQICKVPVAYLPFINMGMRQPTIQSTHTHTHSYNYIYTVVQWSRRQSLENCTIALPYITGRHLWS